MLPELAAALGRKPAVIGGWMPSLLEAMRNSQDVEFAVATIDRKAKNLAVIQVNGVTYFQLPGDSRKGCQLTVALRSACIDAINAYKPDIIHVHGTEEVYGLFTALYPTACPVVISLQGLIHVYSRYVRGGLSLVDYYSLGKIGLLAWFRYLLQEYHWRKRGVIEKQVIRSNRHFIGRTAWDMAHVLAVNPAANYFHGAEILRPAFFASRWDIGRITRRSIFCAAAHSPLKGFHWLLRAVAFLRHEYPDIIVRVAGAPWNNVVGFGYYGKFIRRLIDMYGLESHVIPLSDLTAEEVVAELKSAHAFVIPSLIENSPNSLAEAMLVGTPSIAAFVGGIPSMIDDEVTVIGYPSGDWEYLSHSIRRIFENDSLAERLSRNSRGVAMDRHDSERVASRQLAIYRQVIAEHSKQHLLMRKT